MCACACVRVRVRALSLSLSLSLSLCLSVCLSVSLSRPHCASLPFFTAHTRRMFFFSFLFLVVCSAIVNSASGLALAGISEYFSVSRAAHSSQVYRVCGSGLEVIVAHHPLLWPSFSFPSFPLADLPSRPLLFNDCMQTLSELVSYYETHYIPLPNDKATLLRFALLDPSPFGQSQHTRAQQSLQSSVRALLFQHNSKQAHPVHPPPHNPLFPRI